MRIKMAGGYCLFEFQDAVDCIVQALKHNGVDELRSVNIYLQPFGSSGEPIHFDDQETGAPFQILTYQGARSREFHVTSPRLQPEREARPVAVAMPMFDPPRPRGDIAQFIGLFDGRGVEQRRAGKSAAGRGART
jgi:hypothetical protein